MTAINKMEFFGDYHYKTPQNKRKRPIYTTKGTYTKAFKELIKANQHTNLPSDLRYVYNPNTNRFISKAKLIDNRYKTQIIKEKYKDQYSIVNNNVRYIS